LNTKEKGMNMTTKNMSINTDNRDPITIDSILALFKPDSHPDLHIFEFIEIHRKNFDATISKFLMDQLSTFNIKDQSNLSTLNQILRNMYEFFNSLLDAGRWNPCKFSRPSKNQASKSFEDHREIHFDWCYSDCYYVRSVDFWEVVEWQFAGNTIRLTIINGLEYSSLRSLGSNQGQVHEQGARKVVLQFKGFDWLPSRNLLVIRLEFALSEANQISGKRTGSQNVCSFLTEQILQKIREEADRLTDIGRTLDLEEFGKSLEKNLKRCSNKKPTDIYIFKDLQTRLYLELQSYIATKIAEISAENTVDKLIQSERLTVLIRTRKIIEGMIPLVSSIEDALCNLWIQSKEISSEDYLITLDLIDPKWYSRILENLRQREQWKALYSMEIDSLSQIYTNTLFGKSVLKLPLDTGLFSDPLRSELIKEAKEKPEHGLLVKANNFDGLIYLKSLYANKVKCIYIDPPYNTGNESFVFKDNYSHSSWLTMMENRLRIAHELLTEDGYILISIDYNELNNLLSLMNLIFGSENLVEIFAWAKTLTPPSLSVKSRRNLEYIVCYEKNKTNIHYKGPFSSKSEDQPILNSGNPLRAVKFPAGTVSTKLKFSEYKAGQYPKAKLLKDITIKDGKIVEDLEVEIESKWSQQKIDEEVAQGTRFVINSELFSIRFIRKPTIGFNAPKTLILGKSGEEEAEIGTNETSQKEIKNYGLSFDDYPKPIGLIKYLLGFNTNNDDIILDFFAGSGTTGDATIALNQTKYREGNRKFILIESEKHFETDLKARIQKRIFSDEWEMGKPKNQNGISHCVRYLSLFSFYDLLNK
jgi:adenine-specific DNA-methyltransferase